MAPPAGRRPALNNDATGTNFHDHPHDRLVRVDRFDRALGAGDSRPSLQERYPTHGVYVAKVTAAANSFVQQRFLLPEEAASIIAAANAAAVP